MKKHRFYSLMLLALALSCGGGAANAPGTDAGPDLGLDSGYGTDPGLADESAGPESLDGRDAGLDASEVPADLPADSNCPGCSQQPCTDNAQCNSGYCIETPDGKRCAALCASGETCPLGYLCVQVATVPDVTYACVDPAPRTCRPCMTQADCESAFSQTPMACAGFLGTWWCVPKCPEAGCPAGTKCLEEAADRAAASVCVPDDGCRCTALGEGASGRCDKTGAAGTCSGAFACQDGKPSPCDAPEAQVETCNAKDDDCNGQTDDGLAASPCDITNAYGTCKGQDTCIAGKLLCQGSEPKPEVCNGLDENCDAKTDEGFTDLDQDGVADCVDDDRDGDGVTNGADDCPDLANPDQADTDADGKGDVCDDDDDGDGVLDPFDDCPLVKNPDQADLDGDGLGNVCDDDRDGDGLPNGGDNCPDAANPDQADLDGDGLGNACDADRDGDGVLDAVDDCPDLANPDQADLDKDGKGDACDDDRDGDGVPNSTDDCPDAANPDQADFDGDGLGDACDPDRDGDGVPNDTDNCPGTPNAGQEDKNGNKIGDACENDWDGDGVLNTDDNCPWAVNPGQEDLDLDSVGDACDCDLDGDGVANANPDCPAPHPTDNCPATANPGQEDLDGDGAGDACDPDLDGDGDPDETDCAPLDKAVFHGQTESCNGIDDDCDGVTDGQGATGCLNRYFDEDGDGFGVTLVKCLCVMGGNYRALVSGDCNDKEPLVNPSAQEVCGNGKDDNCNGSENDEGATGCVTWYTDLDGDGFGVGPGKCLCASTGDLSAKKAGDCNDQDPAVNPGLAEKCADGKDNDCNGLTDEEGCQGCTTYYQDVDQDKYGVDTDKKCLSQAAWPYTALAGGDCNDDDPNIRPGATEVCNGRDDNCDGQVDPTGISGCQLFYPDVDRDGYGANLAAICYCAPTGAYTAAVAGDCNDGDADVNPARTEGCDGKDNNCNGQVDEGVTKTWFKDADEDGWGVAGDSQALCAAAKPYSAAQSGDCDDTDADRYPTHPEGCDGRDNNCNGQVDEGVLRTFYKDNDGDGHGGTTQTQACALPEGYADESGDCNDFNADIHPGAVETCNDIDDNCNGKVDDGVPTASVYRDLDGDGFGGINALAAKHCLIGGMEPPLGYSLSHDDCDDSKSTVYPGAPELCDGIKNDCNVAVADSLCPSLCQGKWPVPVGGGIYYPAVGQLDGDNEMELVTAAWGKVRVYEHDGTIKWEKDASVNYCNPTLADMNGDGVLDVVTPSGDVSVEIFSGIDGAKLASIPAPGSGYHYGATVFDVDGDGTMDVIPHGSSPYHLLLLKPDLTLKASIPLAPLAGETFQNTRASLYDLTGDGIPEIFVGSGYGTCSNDPTSCKGRQYVFTSTGAFFNDPTWKDPARPWFQVQGFPNTFTNQGDGTTFTDVDGDGVQEVTRIMRAVPNGQHTWERYVWNKAGEVLSYAVNPDSYQIAGSLWAPVGPDGKLDSSGKTTRQLGPVADIDGDGIYEVVYGSADGLVVTKKGQVVDGYPVKVAPTWPILADLNRDGRLDIVYLSSTNNSLNCYTLGPGTYSDSRILAYGGVDAFTRGANSNGNLDPYEPNDIRNKPFDPTQAGGNPILASRAFPLRGLRDLYNSNSSCWALQIRALIGEKGDRDYYWVRSGLIYVTLSGMAKDYDLYLHRFSADGKVLGTLKSTKSGTESESIECHSLAACSEPGQKTFILEVRGKDPDKDYGPIPYTLSTNWTQ